MSEKLILFASPGWVNLLFLTPFVAFFLWRGKLAFSFKTLVVVAIFAASFGFVEASVVVYLRALAGFSDGILSAIASASTKGLPGLSVRIINVEIFREAATIVMLLSVAFLSTKKAVERFAVFFWAFAIWDISYYVWLYVTTGWPPTLSAPDVLFLIPEPWESQVWFPVLISFLFLAAVLLGRAEHRKKG